MKIKDRLNRWLDKGYRDAYENLGLPVDEDLHTYLFALQWYDTGHVTNALIKAPDKRTAHTIFRDSHIGDKGKFGIVNIIQLD